ncbi:hypothetical protein GCM10028773_19730 [Spirosoma koreense]
MVQAGLPTLLTVVREVGADWQAQVGLVVVLGKQVYRVVRVGVPPV